ncbi:hypothetical protein L2E82_05007 [Cichorium intybus]|uniref:Uncharacterized protein n=1 Tax=Cichorium intybus TaxID=13427 RepID=A0ACB9H6G0_CICIN|nr:hypothetical protein L2E82_05007 [Cichorium intybus]
MLAAIKMEVMTPAKEAPDEGCVAIDFHMPPICSPIVRSGRPAEVAHVASKQLSETIIRQDFDIIFHIQELITFETVASYCNFYTCSSGMIDLKELSLVSGKAAWMTYLAQDCITLSRQRVKYQPLNEYYVNFQILHKASIL